MSIIVINYYKMQSGRNTLLTGFSSDLRFASQSPPVNFKAAKRRSVFRLTFTVKNPKSELQNAIILLTRNIYIYILYCLINEFRIQF